MNIDDKIFVAGHRGMVGSAICRRLEKEGFRNILTRTRKELDLTDSISVNSFFEQEKPDYVILSAAKVGGINANMHHQADFLFENLSIQNNVIYAAFKNSVKKLCFLGSSCIYPCKCPQPIKEEYLLTGPLEPTNEGYAIAKIAGYKLAYYLSKQYGMNTISLMPCNLYGPNDNYDPENSHVFPALIRRFTNAVERGDKEIVLWGSGSPLREFMHVDDLARAVMFLIQNHNDPEFLNVGAGTDISIKDLAGKIAFHAGFKGIIKWDTDRPDGMFKKCMDVSKLKSLGFTPEISIDDGIEATIEDYKLAVRNNKLRT